MSRYRLHPTPGPAGGAAGPLRPRPVHLEPGRRTALPLAPRPQERTRLPGAVPAAHRRASGEPVAGGRLPDGPAAGAARLPYCALAESVDGPARGPLPGYLWDCGSAGWAGRDPRYQGRPDLRIAAGAPGAAAPRDR